MKSIETHFKLRNFLILPVLLSVFCGAALCRAQPVSDPKWYDARNFTVEGKGWKNTARFYDRLPAQAENSVRPEVWKLSRHSAGISVRFSTDSDFVSARWKLHSPSLALPNMTATAVSGVDLYVREKGKWLWAGSGKADKSSINEQKLVSNMIRRKREFMLYLPLYNGVETVEIGLAENSSVSAPNALENRPVVFYGTSIVQGASASRPGMAYPSIIGRRLNRPVINLGFSGNGKMEMEMARLLTEIDAAVYVIDCLPNLSSGAEVEDRTPKLIEILRRSRPRVPIVLVENIKYPDVFIEERKRRIYREKNAALRRVYDRMVLSKNKNIYYISGDTLIGTDGESTIDGVHPTDTGFMRMSSVFEPVLGKILILP